VVIAAIFAHLRSDTEPKAAAPATGRRGQSSKIKKEETPAEESDGGDYHVQSGQSIDMSIVIF
jgi:hypothetical protein